jgi:CBS-domain-containing membrane protein
MRADLSVQDIMRATKSHISCDDHIQDAAKKLVDLNLPGLPVLSSDGKLVGMLTEHDCVDYLLSMQYYQSEKQTAKEIMSSSVVSVKPGMLIVELASQMRQGKPKYYPVVDSDGKLVGEITRSMVLKALL